MYADLGRIVANPETRTTPAGKAVCNFTIAVDDMPDEQGNRRSNFIDCVAWGKRAEAIAKYFTKGSRIYVGGDLKTHTYTDKNNTKHKVTEVFVTEFKFCEGKGNGTAAPQTAAPTAPQETPYDIPTPDYAVDNSPSFEDIPADDLPF